MGFENKFRGSEVEITARLLQYVHLFERASDVLDLGCGRGEFLSLLRERGISARGLDINHEMVEACLARGLDATEGDALAYLESLPDASLGGLIAVQVVEHFQPPYLVRFLDTAYHKLKPGSTVVLETLNPSCWFAFFEAYLRDITHAWPLHPETLKFLVVASGFQRVDVRLLSPYPIDARLQPVQLPPEALTVGMVSLAQTFNENVDKLNAVMYSYLDYAVVAETDLGAGGSRTGASQKQEARRVHCRLCRIQKQTRCGFGVFFLLLASCFCLLPTADGCARRRTPAAHCARP